MIQKTISDFAPPIDDAQPVVYQNPVNDLPDGVHCGVWYSPKQQEYWKPTTCIPHRVATERYPTDELLCLRENQDLACIPPNWRIHTDKNGLDWIVRRPARMVEPKEARQLIKADGLVMLEQTLRELNRRGWAVGDHLSVAIDRETYVPFILDLSCAMKRSSPINEDEERWFKWLDVMGWGYRAKLWRKARHESFNLELPRDFWAGAVYASYNRPVSFSWFPVRDVHLVQRRDSTGDGIRCHTWVVTRKGERLSDDMCYSFELQEAYLPWP